MEPCFVCVSICMCEGTMRVPCGLAVLCAQRHRDNTSALGSSVYESLLSALEVLHCSCVCLCACVCVSVWECASAFLCTSVCVSLYACVIVSI